MKPQQTPETVSGGRDDMRITEMDLWGPDDTVQHMWNHSLYMPPIIFENLSKPWSILSTLLVLKDATASGASMSIQLPHA